MKPVDFNGAKPQPDAERQVGEAEERFYRARQTYFISNTTPNVLAYNEAGRELAKVYKRFGMEGKAKAVWASGALGASHPSIDLKMAKDPKERIDIRLNPVKNAKREKPILAKVAKEPRRRFLGLFR